MCEAGVFLFSALWAHLPMIFVCSFLHWSCHITKFLGSPYNTLGRMPGACTKVGARVLPLITLALAYILSLAPTSNHDWSCTVLLSFRLIWHLYTMFKAAGCLSWSFKPSRWQSPEATPPAQQRDQLDCKQPTHGQDKAPEGVPTDMI